MELNIGHFLIGEAIFRGLDPAIREMRRLMDEARNSTSHPGGRQQPDAT
jgi:pyridoxine 5-phosphate synthase